MLLDRVVRSASKTIGSTLPTVDELYETLHEFYYVAQSSCRYISERTRMNRYRNTFLPTSATKREIGEGKMIGEDGGIQWGALLSYNFALSLLIVTTNVVVLCEYLPQECPLWGLLKVIVLYCIVLYCIVLYCIVLYCIVLYCIVLYCIVLYCIVLYCIVLSGDVITLSGSYYIIRRFYYIIRQLLH